MRAATHVEKMNVPTRTTSESAISHAGTPKGRRAIMMMGEVKGKIDAQKESELEGSCIVWMAM